MSMVDVTIKMPKDWVEQFWGWWLDGGGEQEFLEDVDKTECQDGCTWSDWDEKRRLLVYAQTQSDLKEGMRRKDGKWSCPRTRNLALLAGSKGRKS